mgnify:CR=1 FL=1
MNNRNTKEKEYHSFETPYTVSITIQGKKKPPGQVAGGFFRRNNLELNVKLDVSPVRIICAKTFLLFWDWHELFHGDCQTSCGTSTLG